jgi:hypothetical protein
MFISEWIHEYRSHHARSFAEFAIADHFLYWISADAAIGLLQSWPPTIEGISQNRIRIWDEQKLAPADVVHFVSMAEPSVPT